MPPEWWWLDCLLGQLFQSWPAFWEKKPPKPPSLQTKQEQLPQLLLIRPVCWNLHQFCFLCTHFSTSMSFLQQVGAKMNTRLRYGLTSAAGAGTLTYWISHHRAQYTNPALSTFPYCQRDWALAQTAHGWCRVSLLWCIRKTPGYSSVQLVPGDPTWLWFCIRQSPEVPSNFRCSEIVMCRSIHTNIQLFLC